MAAKGATLLHHLAVWMIEENKTKEATSANTSLATQHPETLAPAGAETTQQGPLYENLQDLKLNKGDNLSFRAEVTLDKDVSTSTLTNHGNASF